MSEVNPIRKSIFLNANNESLKKSIRFTIAARAESFMKSALGKLNTLSKVQMKLNGPIL